MKTSFLLLLQFTGILSLIPVIKIVSSNNLMNLNSYNLRYDMTGIYLKFDFDSEMSFLPYEVYQIIVSEYSSEYVPCEQKNINFDGKEFEAFWCDREGIAFFSNLNLITEKYVIKINAADLFTVIDNEYYFRFISSRNIENIVIDKNLSDLMKVELLDNDDFTIHNETFIYQFGDDD